MLWSLPGAQIHCTATDRGDLPNKGALCQGKQKAHQLIPPLSVFHLLIESCLSPPCRSVLWKLKKSRGLLKKSFLHFSNMHHIQ